LPAAARPPRAVIELTPARRIEELHLRLREVARRFVEPAPEQLRHRIRRLIFQRKLLLPPKQQRVVMLLNVAIRRVRAGIEAEPVVKVVGQVVVPAVPLTRIVRKSGSVGAGADVASGMVAGGDTISAVRADSVPRAWLSPARLSGGSRNPLFVAEHDDHHLDRYITTTALIGS
jgi:hypothetical protein